MNTCIPILACLALAATTFAAEIKISSDRDSFAKNNPTREGVPVEAFQFDPALGKDLQIEVWATTPQIYSPVAMDVDAQGRVWATEGIDYNQRPLVTAGQSIMVLEDKDGDGKADSSHAFVTEKGIRPAPFGVAVFDNKVVLSAAPSIIVYTDVNRNAVFDPGIDTREVFLTGFNGGKADHTLHAVVGGPSGQWYFSHGNMGLDVKTKDGRHYIAGSYYGSPEYIGKKSWDGQLYVGGMAFRINPDGTGLMPVGENLRNTMDMSVNSFGDIFQSDNDDPANCRVTWLMEYGNLGYADIENGSKSWEEVAKTWDEVAKSWGSPERLGAHCFSLIGLALASKLSRHNAARKCVWHWLSRRKYLHRRHGTGRRIVRPVSRRGHGVETDHGLPSAGQRRPGGHWKTEPLPVADQGA